LVKYYIINKYIRTNRFIISTQALLKPTPFQNGSPLQEESTEKKSAAEDKADRTFRSIAFDHTPPSPRNSPPPLPPTPTFSVASAEDHSLFIEHCAQLNDLIEEEVVEGYDTKVMAFFKSFDSLLFKLRSSTFPDGSGSFYYNNNLLLQVFELKEKVESINPSITSFEQFFKLTLKIAKEPEIQKLIEDIAIGEENQAARNFFYPKFFTQVGSLEEKEWLSEESLLQKITEAARADSAHAPSPQKERCLQVAERAQELYVRIIESGKSQGIIRHYHATSKPNNVPSILSGGIHVTHEKELEGAFVSTKPEWTFGDFVLTVRLSHDASALKRVSHLLYIQAGKKDESVWIGYDRPLSPSTDYIVYNDRIENLDDELTALEILLEENGNEGIRMRSSSEEEAFLGYIKRFQNYSPAPDDMKRVLSPQPGTPTHASKRGLTTHYFSNEE
jgi:hypothetical protein